MKQFKLFLLMLLLFSLTACTSWWNREQDENSAYKGMSAKQLMTSSQKAISKEQYQSAAKQLEAMESMYPFSDYAESAQLNLIYAYYQNKDYPSASATAERFIHLYPRARHVDYAYYMKGLADFQQVRGSLTNILPVDESWRDPGTQSQAYNDFAVLVQKFPQSRYKANALQRMIFLRNMLAQRELNTANYYFERKMYVAAAERANFLIKNYQQAPSVQPALVLLYKANVKMGLKKAAGEALAVYRATYPNQPMDLRG